MRFHRSLRPDHVLKGVILELGRAKCFLEKVTGEKGQTGCQYVLALSNSFRIDNESVIDRITRNRESIQGIGERARSEVIRDEHSAVLADHSSDIITIYSINGKVGK